jgi:hypothetical protein
MPLPLLHSWPVLSDAGTEWSDGVAVAYRVQQQRNGVGFAALIRRREVWAICAAQYTGALAVGWPSCCVAASEAAGRLCTPATGMGSLHSCPSFPRLDLTRASFAVTRAPAKPRLCHAFPHTPPARPPSRTGHLHSASSGRPPVAPAPRQAAGASTACSTGCPPSSRTLTTWRLRSWPPSPCCPTWCRAAWGPPRVRCRGLCCEGGAGEGRGGPPRVRSHGLCREGGTEGGGAAGCQETLIVLVVGGDGFLCLPQLQQRALGCWGRVGRGMAGPSLAVGGPGRFMPPPPHT